MTDTAIIIGLGAILFILFELWYDLRENHANLSLLFFGIGLVVLNVLSYTITQIMLNDSSLTYVKGIANIFYQVIMWFSIIVGVYIVFSLLFSFLKIFINWLWATLGWKPPFKDPKNTGISEFRG